MRLNAAFGLLVVLIAAACVAANAVACAERYDGLLLWAIQAANTGASVFILGAVGYFVREVAHPHA